MCERCESSDPVYLLGRAALHKTYLYHSVRGGLLRLVLCGQRLTEPVPVAEKDLDLDVVLSGVAKCRKCFREESSEEPETVD